MENPQVLTQSDESLNIYLKQSPSLFATQSMLSNLNRILEKVAETESK